MTIKKISCALGFVALLGAAVPSFAQTKPAAAPEPTPAMVSLGREILIGAGVSKTFDLVVPQLLDQMGTRLTQTRPDLIKDLNVVMEQVKPEFDARVPAVIDQAARYYAQRLTEDQLKQVAAFYKSAAGQKFVEVQPLILNDMYVAMQSFSQQISADMMKRVREEMKKKGHEL